MRGEGLENCKKEGLAFLVTILVTWAGLLSDLKAQSSQIALYVSYHGVCMPYVARDGPEKKKWWPYFKCTNDTLEMSVLD